MQVYFCELSYVWKEADMKRYLSAVSEGKRTRIYGMRNKVDKKLTLYADILIRLLACRSYGLKNSELSFTENEYGKPAIIGYPKFCFNISHTQNAIAAGVNDAPVGIDIEKVGRESAGIAKRFFTQDERRYIYRCSNDADRRFFEVWTRKEAYLKYLGCGLSMTMGAFSVTEEGGAGELLYSFREKEYIISVCSKMVSKEAIEFIHLTEEDIEKEAYGLNESSG